MTTVVIPTIEEQELEDVQPLPQAALATNGVIVTPFQLALPNGAGGYVTTFTGIEADLLNSWAVRFGSFTGVTFFPSRQLARLSPFNPEDEIVLTIPSHRLR